MSIPSEQFCRSFAEVSQLLLQAVELALSDPRCDRMARQIAADRDYDVRLVIIFFWTRKEKGEKQLSSIPRYRYLIDEVLHVLPRINEMHFAVKIVESMKKEFPEFGWGLVVESQRKSPIETPHSDLATEIAQQRAKVFRNTPRVSNPPNR